MHNLMNCCIKIYIKSINFKKYRYLNHIFVNYINENVTLKITRTKHKILIDKLSHIPKRKIF